MFGSVPKVLWSQKIPADEENRIQLCTRLLVLKSEERVVLIDVGMGQKWTEKQRKIYEIESLVNLNENQNLLFPTPITDVVLTHLHFDHGGGVTHIGADGKLRLSFPRARHYLQTENWERANAPGPRERATYFPENVQPLASGSLVLTNGEQEILPDVRVFSYRGHTAGLQGVLIGQGSGALWYPADLVPTAHHVALPYVMGYDLSAETTLAEKAVYLGRAADEGWWVVFEHDADTAMVKVARDEKSGFRITEKGTLPLWPTNRETEVNRGGNGAPSE